MAKHGFYSYDEYGYEVKISKTQKIKNLEFKIDSLNKRINKLEEKLTPRKFYYITTVTIDGVFKTITTDGYEYPKIEYIKRVCIHNSNNLNPVINIIATTKMTHEEYTEYCKPE